MHAEIPSSAAMADRVQRRRAIGRALFWGAAVVLLLGLSVGLALIFRQAAPVRVIGSAQAGTDVLLHVGEQLAVTLEGNPTTGYAWRVAALDPAILRQLGEPEFQPASSALGADGTQTIRFTATGIGATSLTLIYARPFEPDTPPLATFDVQIRVSAAEKQP